MIFQTQYQNHNEVIFRVKAAALNYDDIWGMRGKPLAVPLPHISGTDAAGEVTAIGDNVKNIKSRRQNSLSWKHVLPYMRSMH